MSVRLLRHSPRPAKLNPRSSTDAGSGTLRLPSKLEEPLVVLVIVPTNVSEYGSLDGIQPDWSLYAKAPPPDVE